MLDTLGQAARLPVSALTRARDALGWSTRTETGKEAAAQLRIAAPLMFTALVNMGMSITDVIMMGWLGPAALAAGTVASDFYSIVFYLCAGVIAAVAAIVSQARGARRRSVIRRATQQGFWAALILAVPGGLIVWHTGLFLEAVGVTPEVIPGARDYARMMAVALAPMLGVMVWRQFLAAHSDTNAVFRVTLAALALNAAGNYVFMFGKLGLPAMGLAGAGLASALCGLFMFVVLAIRVTRHREYRRYYLLARMHEPDWRRLRELFRVGTPIGLSNLGELGVYLLSTAVMGIFGVEALAAHAVALRMAGVLYAAPVGLAQAATVRVGLAAGAGDAGGRTRAVRTALWMTGAGGLAVLVVVAIARHDIAALFIKANGGAHEIMAYAALLLLVLALSQPFDYLGTVIAGALRGMKDTHVPMLISIGSFWGVAVAVGAGLGFGLDREGLGVWIGLAAGTVLFCLMLAVRLARYRDGSTALT